MNITPPNTVSALPEPTQIDLVVQTSHLSISAASTFLFLAPEIRQLIYIHAFSNSTASYLIHERYDGHLLSDSLHSSSDPATARNVLLVNRQIYSEAISTYWKHTLLRLSGAYWRADDVSRFLSEACAVNVRRLNLETLSHQYTGIVGCFPNLEELRIPDQEVLWWHSDASLGEGDVEKELREGMRYRAVWETVKKHRKLKLKCRITFVVRVGRRTLNQRTWDVDFSKKSILEDARR